MACSGRIQKCGSEICAKTRVGFSANPQGTPDPPGGSGGSRWIQMDPGGIAGIAGIAEAIWGACWSEGPVRAPLPQRVSKPCLWRIGGTMWNPSPHGCGMSKHRDCGPFRWGWCWGPSPKRSQNTIRHGGMVVAGQGGQRRTHVCAHYITLQSFHALDSTRLNKLRQHATNVYKYQNITLSLDLCSYMFPQHPTTVLGLATPALWTSGLRPLESPPWIWDIWEHRLMMVDDDGQCMVGWDRWDIHEALHTSDILWPLIFCIAQSCGSLAVALRRANATNADKCILWNSLSKQHIIPGDPGSVWVYVLETKCTDRHWKTNCSNLLHSFQWHRLWTLGPDCSCSHRGNLRIVLRIIL